MGMIRVLIAAFLVAGASTVARAEVGPSCFPGAFPVEPGSPTYGIDVGSVRFQFWRQPCQDSSGDLIILVRITPLEPPAFICDPAHLTQGATRWRVSVARTLTSTTFCDQLFIIPATMVLGYTPSPVPDKTQAFTLFLLTQNARLDVDAAGAPGPPALVAAVLPSSRSANFFSNSAVATAFATIAAVGPSTGRSCGIDAITLAGLATTLTYQETDPATNVPIGGPNPRVDIAPGGFRTFVLAYHVARSLAPTDMLISFSCTGAVAPIISGVNTLLLSASTTVVPDVVALAATVTNDGIVNVPGPNGLGAFAVATVNVGFGGPITVAADTGGVPVPVSTTLCQTDPATAACLAPPAPTTNVAIASLETPTFSIFVQGLAAVPFDPAHNRIFVRFKDSGGVIRGSTSVAVRTQ